MLSSIWKLRVGVDFEKEKGFLQLIWEGDAFVL